PHFGVCGGCSLQHTDSRTQMAAKQRWLEENLARIGKVEPETILPIVYGENWHYRRRARRGARYVPKKGGAMVGFREKRSSYITDMRECHVLPTKISDLISPLRSLVEALSIRARLPQIEVAVGDNNAVLVIRQLDPLAGDDEALIRAFAERHEISIWLQPGGPESAQPFHPARSELYYDLPEFGVRIEVGPTR